MSSIDWIQIYKDTPALFRSMAYHLESRYEYILIDSRTGLADTAGISTMLMPSKLVLVYVLNKQNLNGVLKVAQQSFEYRINSFDERDLKIYPLPPESKKVPTMRTRRLGEIFIKQDLNVYLKKSIT